MLLEAGLISLLLRGPAFLSRVYSNAAWLGIRDAMICEQKDQNCSLVFGSRSSDSLTAISRKLARALTLDTNNATGRWGLLRLVLISQDNELAISAAQEMISYVQRNPVAYRDTLDAFIMGGAPESAVALFESVRPPAATRVISDSVALALLSMPTVKNATRIVALRPYDLCANYYLWSNATLAEQADNARTYAGSLRYFSEDAILPSSDALLEHTLLIVPELIDKGVWDYKTAFMVLSTLVWQRVDVPGVQELLIELTQRYPEEPTWGFLLAELYQRSGKLEQALTTYHQVWAMQNAPLSTALRLGQVYNALVLSDAVSGHETQRQAVAWFATYHLLVPGDLLGLAFLSQTCAQLESVGIDDLHCRDAAKQVIEDGGPLLERHSIPYDAASSVLQAALAYYADDRRIVANMLQVPVEGIFLGPNLMQDSGFEELKVGKDSTPWRWSDMFNRVPFNAGNFIGGVDSLTPREGQQSARINGLWVQQEEGKSRARAGFWQRSDPLSPETTIVLAANRPYVISFDYRTLDLSGGGTATIWVSEDPDVLWANDHSLPPTGGVWHHFVAVGWNRSGRDARIEPLVRLFGVGQVEFDAVQVRPLLISETLKIQPSTTLFYISTGIQP